MQMVATWVGLLGVELVPAFGVPPQGTNVIAGRLWFSDAGGARTGALLETEPGRGVSRQRVIAHELGGAFGGRSVG